MFVARHVIKAVKDNNLIELKQLIEKYEWNTLYMDNTEMTDDIIGIVIGYIKYNDKIRYIELTDNRITDIGVSNILNKLKTNSISITRLNLSSIQITSVGIKYIAKALKTNSLLLTELHLSDNLINNKKARYLSEALKTNTTLLELSLSFNLITDIGIKYITNTLKHNSTLTTLDLAKNYITDIGVNYILNLLKFNYSITLIYLHNNKIIDKNNEMNIYQYTKRNTDNKKIKNMSLQQRCYDTIKKHNITCPKSYKKLYDNNIKN